MMNIAIVGSGNLGGSLALKLAEAGYYSIFGVRDPRKFKGREIVERNPGILVTSIEEATLLAEVIIVSSTPVSVFHIAEILSKVKPAKNKVIIDTMNSIVAKPDPYQNTTEALIDITGYSKIVKCFNTTGFENILNPVINGEKIDTYVAGDSSEAKDICEQFTRDLGMGNCVDFGDSNNFQVMEDLAKCWMHLAHNQQLGQKIAFKLLAGD